MDRPLIKTYFLLLLSIALITVFLPAILGKTSEWLTTLYVRLNLLVYNYSAKEAPMRLREETGRVVIVFDDGWDTQYMQGYDMLKKYGYQACVAVIPTRVGEEGYMTMAQLAHLYKDGWDMLNHTYDHTPLREADMHTQRLEINGGQAWLRRNYLKRGEEILVFPEGAYNADTLELMRENHYAAGRSLNAVWLSEEDTPMHGVKFCNLCSGETVENVTALLDDAIENHSTLMLIVHKLEPETENTGMQYDAGKLEEILAYIHEREEFLSVLTFTELLHAQAVLY